MTSDRHSQDSHPPNWSPSMSIRPSALVSVVAILGLVVPSVGAATVDGASNAAPCFAPFSGRSERATWSSTSQDVIDYTNELIRLNPRAGIVITGQTETLTSPDGTTLVRPNMKVPAGVVFDFVED